MYARRNVLKGVASAPLAGLPLAAVLAMPEAVRAAAATLHDYTIRTPAGRRVTAALAMPKGVPAPAVIVIHEWWGLNDQIKAVTAALAEEGFLAVAVDLMDGAVAATPDEAQALAAAVVTEEATDTLVGWAQWLGVHDASSRRLATVGWCFGGGWSLDASIATPVDATVVYYGRVTRTARDLQRLKGPVLGHFATRDRFVDRAMVAAWQREMDMAGKAHVAYWYDADHAFANPTDGRYDREDAALAWQRTLAFLNEHL